MIVHSDRYLEFRVLSRVGVAAIAAITDEIAHKFPEVEHDTTARQFCGAMVAEVMRRHGHEVVQPRGRVGGTWFSYGAVFSPQPVRLAWGEVIDELALMPDRVLSFVVDMSETRWCQRSSGTGFALVEHACHLRDLDAIFIDRIDATLSTHLPVIDSVDGTVLAEQRNYAAQDLQAAIRAFKRGRRRLCLSLEKLQPEQLTRCCLRDGNRRMTLEELVRELLDHDRTHCLELDELGAELQLLPKNHELQQTP
nr:DinB family protein [Paraburkholderia aspalathi]